MGEGEVVMKIVRYWWTADGDEEICSMKNSVAIGNERCWHCDVLMEAERDMKELVPLRRIEYHYITEHIQPEKYYVCNECIDRNVVSVPGRNYIPYNELIDLLKSAWTVEEILEKQYEIGALIPSVYVMFRYNQNNSYHQYDLWEHCVHTVVNLPRGVEDDMLYLAALLHDVGKPDCLTWKEDEPNDHYYGHPKKSAEIVQKEVIPCLKEAGTYLSEEEVKRLLYYVEYHDYKMSHREKHLKKHLAMVSLDEFKNLLLLQIADAKAHVMCPFVVERIRICKEWCKWLEERTL